MREDRTTNLLYLIAELQERHGPYPLGRPALVTWLADELEKTPGETGVRRIEAEFPAHLANLDTQQ